MTLRECYIDHSYYYPRLECEMKRAAGNLNGLRTDVVKVFCNETLSGHTLDSAEDYRDILELFRSFVSGVGWAQSNSVQ